MQSSLLKSAGYLTVALSMAPETTNAIRLAQEDSQADAGSNDLSLQADLSLPLSVQLGEAKFTNKASCPLTDDAAQDDEPILEEEAAAEDITDEAIAGLAEPTQ